MFNYAYLLRIRNRLEDNVRVRFGSLIDVPQVSSPEASFDSIESNVDLFDDDMSRLQDIAPDDYMDYRREIPTQERPAFQFPSERDHSSWMNQYEQEREQSPPDEFPFQDFNYGP